MSLWMTGSLGDDAGTRLTACRCLLLLLHTHQDDATARMRTNATTPAAMPPLAPNDKPGGDEGAADVIGAVVAVVVMLDGVVVVVAANLGGVLDEDVGDYKACVGIKVWPGSACEALSLTIVVVIDEYLLSLISEMEEIDKLCELLTRNGS